MTVRQACDHDCARIGLISAVRSGAEPAERAERVRAFLSGKAARGEGVVFVAEADGVVVGFGRAEWLDAPDTGSDRSTPPGWYLSGLVVEASFRRRGIGSALTRARLEWLRQRTDRVFYVANASNAASIRMHERMGFREIARGIEAPGVTFADGEGTLFERVDR
jgi:aminoglycoside 6'-N-acetyltransferase I